LAYYLDYNIKSKDESYINKGNLGLTKIPLEIKLKGEDKPRYNSLISKYDDFNRIELTHRRGALAMARAQLLNSASIQFYISLKDLPELDGRYAVFGRVVDGMNVIDSLNEGDLILNMKVIKN
jgi:peptidyl-prolyl cis-trans isomerase B (cyclophilin B)